MKEVEAHAGDHITRACERLAAAAPAFMMFNEIRLEAAPGDTSGDLVSRYHRESNKRAAEYEAKRRAHEATPEGQRELAEARRRADAEKQRQADAIAAIELSGVRKKYPWPETMGEISGLGGSYEAACRTMLYAGLRLVEEKGPGVDEKELERAILDAEPGCSGAMFGATRGAIRFIAANGWLKYVEAMTKAERSSGSPQ